jgi:hypothetical protein
MWHFGADGLVEYTGAKFCITWGSFRDFVVRLYSKSWGDGKIRVRLERQENPEKTLFEAIQEKLDPTNVVLA